MNFVAIDFETANSKRYSPCSIGVVVANINGIVDEYYTLINPLMEFDSFNTYIHGIHEMDVVDAPTFDQVWDDLIPYLDNNLIIAHNASFDMSVLRHTLDRYNLQYPTCDYLCSVMLSKKIWPGLENYKLNTLADFRNIVFHHHNALEDARVAAQILIHAMKEKEMDSVSKLSDVHTISQGRIYERGYVPPKARKLSGKKTLYSKNRM
ncbi:3'-5' exonuclease [Aquibacillus koreensis]|uniref:3'-5' exonuclease n=1 Tax=Aquibacillus koreensis TaxID=279446 RepID=A0A9X3WSY4_9BACI|nr:3'-5' exonuclease [Aquibacillus koreensis]MCT2535262.1 3'-5' exonuclease [Aquibacillus koreensis]MDC3422779.1 3'-5' exonuclease [Aquibacillus koreensis]